MIDAAASDGSLPRNIVIVGAGQAGGQAAASLRQAGYDGRLVLIGDEPQLPYQRPPLSKKYLAGELNADRLLLFPEMFYRDNGIECIFGMRAAQLDAVAREVVLADGARIGFDRALLATGSRSRVMPVPGLDLERVFSLRNMGDVDRIRPSVQAGRRAVVIGGGYIGLEVAAMVRVLGLDVEVIEAAPRVMARTAPEIISRYFESLHAREGVTFHLGAGVREIRRGGPEGTLSVVTDGEGHAADWVLVGIGGQPNVEMAEAAGLTIDNGIAVDEFCRTSAPNVFAAGDCTSFPSARYGRRLRLESVQNAVDQAKAAALSMIGKGEPYDPVPWFWSDQYDTKFQIAGLGQDADQHVVRGDPATGKFAVGHLLEGRLIALDAINRPRDYMQARRLVPTALPIDAKRFENPEVALDECFG